MSAPDLGLILQAHLNAKDAEVHIERTAHDFTNLSLGFDFIALRYSFGIGYPHISAFSAYSMMPRLKPSRFASNHISESMKRILRLRLRSLRSFFFT